MARRALWIAAALALGLMIVYAVDLFREDPSLLNSPQKRPQQSQPSRIPTPSKVLSITLNGVKDRELELGAIANYLRDIGVDAQVRTWEEYDPMVAEARAGHLDAYATDWGSATFTPVDLAIPKLRTNDRGNFSRYTSPEVDALLDIAASVTDDTAANNAYFRVQDILFRDAPWIFGYYRDGVEAASVRVKNWRPSSDNRINLHKVELDGSDAIVVALRSDRIQSLDPADYRDRETETVVRNVFDGLVTRSPDGIVVPELAQSWTIPDPRTYIFQLRRGVKFHNGDMLTADDVVFTFNRILDPKGIEGRQSPRVGLLGPLEKVERLDDYHVKMTLSVEYSAFLQLLVHTQIIPRRYYEKTGFEAFGRAPVGTGPFKFVSGQLDEEMVMERFNDYWDGSPPIKKAVFRMLRKPAARIAALKAGEAHIINEVPPDSVEGLRQDPAIQVQVAQGTRMYQVELNNTRIDDPRVRQALNYALNLNVILQDLYKGYAHRVSTAFLPNGFGYNPGLAPYIYNPDRARDLLQQAGYSVR